MRNVSGTERSKHKPIGSDLLNKGIKAVFTLASIGAVVSSMYVGKNIYELTMSDDANSNMSSGVRSSFSEAVTTEPSSCVDGAPIFGESDNNTQTCAVTPEGLVFR